MPRTRSTSRLLGELRECYANQRRLEAQLCEADFPALPPLPKAKPPLVPDSLARLLDLRGERLTPFEVARHLYTYIEQHELLDKSNGFQIEANRRLRRALQMDPDDNLDLYNLQVYLHDLYLPEGV